MTPAPPAREVLKLRSTRLWIGLLLGAAALTVLGAIATLAVAGTAKARPGRPRPRCARWPTSGLRVRVERDGLFTLILGAVAITGEYRSGTIAGTFLATPTRSPVIVAKAVACCCGRLRRSAWRAR